MVDRIPASEADIKRAVSDRLEYAQNQGELMFFRLNAGDFIELRGETRRRVKGLPAGTSDFLVLQAYEGDAPICIVSFIEVKKPKGGKQSQKQKEFAEKVTRFHAHYYLVTSVEELMEIIRIKKETK